MGGWELYIRRYIHIRKQFGAAALALAFVVGAVGATAFCYGWYRTTRIASASTEWRTSAIEAKFWKVISDEEPRKIEFFYIVRNNTATDYILNSESSVTLFLVGPRNTLVATPERFANHFKLSLPLVVPAKHQATYEVLELNGLDRKAIERIGGFKIFDRKNRYEILLPKGW